MLERGGMARRFRWASLAALLVACARATSGDPSSNGGSSGVGDGGTGNAGHTSGSSGAHPAAGGAGPSTGGAGPGLPDCENPVAAGTACAVQSAHCGGPCSNSWQAENACNNGMWELARVIPCGSNASHAPQCRSGEQSTPCCPEGTLACVDKPDGYPGFGCTPRDGSLCSCICDEAMQVCAC
jgi:hypothetical protein